MGRCDTCLESRCVISENGIHYICCLNEKASIACLLHRDDHYVENPMRKNSRTVEDLQDED